MHLLVQFFMESNFLIYKSTLRRKSTRSNSAINLDSNPLLINKMREQLMILMKGD